MKAFKLNITNRLTWLDLIKLETLSNEHRVLYNNILNYVKSNKTSDFKLINAFYRDFRNESNLTINSKSSQNTSRSLINSIKSFFKLKQNKLNNAKFPYKFKSHKYFTSFTYDWNNGQGGFKFIDNKLVIQSGLLSIDLNNDYFRSLNINDNTIKTITFKRENNRYYLIFVFSEQPSNKCLDKSNFLSIDLGVTNIASCFSNVIDPFIIKNKRLNEKKVEAIQSKRDKKVKGSKTYLRLSQIFRKEKRKISDKNKDYQHKVSRVVVGICRDSNIGRLVIGDIKTKSCKVNYKCKLNKSTQNNGYMSRFKAFLVYKARNEGINVELVKEHYTSQENCLTGLREFSSSLDKRSVELRAGLTVDRDINSAVNIAKRVKQLGSVWLDHIERQVMLSREMVIDEHSKLIYN